MGSPLPRQRSRERGVPLTQTSRPGLVHGALAGGLLGLVDAIDTLLGGWASALPFPQIALLVLVMLVLGAAAGVVIALCCTPFAIFVTKRFTWPPLHQAQACVAIALAIATGVLVWGFRMALALSPMIMIIAALLAGATLVMVSMRGRGRPAYTSFVWLALFSWSYLVGARLLYAFSRHGAATLLHAAWGLGLCLLLLALVSTSIPIKAARARSLALMLALALAALAFTGPVLDHAPHSLRLVLYERTCFAFRLLSALPHRGSTVEELGHDCDLPVPVEIVEGAPSAAPKVRGVVFIMVDALRGDRVPSKHTPRLSALGREGYRFARAYTTAPVTRYATESMMTGTSPSFAARKTSPVALGEVLSRAQVQTIALSGHAYLQPWVGDFQTYEELVPKGSKANREALASPDAFARAAHHLDQLGNDAAFFLMVHFYDPHAHYVDNPLFPAGSSLEARYDGEVAYADHYIGRLLDHIDARKLADDVAIIVVGDHGEEHGEHRYRWHRARVYDESVRVPLLLRVPGMPGAAVIENLVSVMDLAPTILQLYGLPVPYGIDGESLLSKLVEPWSKDERALFIASDIYPSYAVVQEDHKVIANLHTGIMEHYDLSADPSEVNNLADEATPRFTQLRCKLAQWIAHQH